MGYCSLSNKMMIEENKSEEPFSHKKKENNGVSENFSFTTQQNYSSDMKN
jgi:hypothetical protein